MGIGRSDALGLDVAEDSSALFVVEADENPTVPCTNVLRRLPLVENDLQPKEADLNYVRPTTFVVRPV
jgi:hypothetical protein